jgi:hypothetical protein
MNKESLTLTGHVVSVNAADQSFLLESAESPNRLRVYANDKMFRKLNRSFQSAWFNETKGKEPTGIFYIQGRVLIGFIKEKSKSLAECYPAFTALVEREFPSK